MYLSVYPSPVTRTHNSDRPEFKFKFESVFSSKINLYDKPPHALELVLGGYPLQLACWIVSGMKKNTYAELKKYILLNFKNWRDLEQRQNAFGFSNMNDEAVLDIIKEYKITGNWKDMPKSDFKEMLAASYQMKKTG
jgi:hypothetical protein